MFGQGKLRKLLIIIGVGEGEAKMKLRLKENSDWGEQDKFNYEAYNRWLRGGFRTFAKWSGSSYVATTTKKKFPTLSAPTNRDLRKREDFIIWAIMSGAISRPKNDRRGWQNVPRN